MSATASAAGARGLALGLTHFPRSASFRVSKATRIARQPTRRRLRGAELLLNDNWHGRTMSRAGISGIYGDCRRHLVLVVRCKHHLVVGDIPGLGTDHATPCRVAKIGHGG